VKYRYSFLAFLIGFILQSTVLHNIQLFGVTPNLILILVIAFSFLFEEKHGLVFGILFGVLQDMLFSPIIGISSAAYFGVALMASIARKYLYRDNFLSVISIAAIGTLGFNLIYWGLSSIFGGTYDVVYFLLRQPVALIYNTLILAFLNWFLIRKVIRYRGFKYM
jgi:rod shape-determining protein MreD